MLRVLFLTGLLFTISGPTAGQGRAPTCDSLVWSAQVLQANPNIARACQGVYVRRGELFAKIRIEVTRVRGNVMTFRPFFRDGTQGAPRSIEVPADWRVNLDGRLYHARDLAAGQELSIYMPEDRFALASAEPARDESADADSDAEETTAREAGEK